MANVTYMESNLPGDVTSKILLRLPVKSLVRFKSVDKSWISFISDPYFSKLHFDLTAPHNHQLLLFVSLSEPSKVQIQSIDLERTPEYHSKNFISPIPSSQVRCLPILGVCRGFILLGYCRTTTFWPPTYLLVWNPLTGVHKTLSYSPFASNNFVTSNKFQQVHYSFEYDPSRDDYFVVIAWIEGLDLFSRHVKCFEFFSIRTNSWLQIDATLLPHTRHLIWEQPNFSFLHGAIHWLDTSENNSEPVKAIIAFDFIERNVYEIPLPHDDFVQNPFDKPLTLEVIGGCLCLLDGPRQQPSFAEIWMMKEYKVKSSWIKSNYVPAHAIPQCCFRPIYFTKGGEVVGFDDSNVRLVKLDNKGELLRYSDHICFRKHYIYTESLLSLTSDGAQA